MSLSTSSSSFGAEPKELELMVRSTPKVPLPLPLPLPLPPKVSLPPKEAPLPPNEVTITSKEIPVPLHKVIEVPKEVIEAPKEMQLLTPQIAKITDDNYFKDVSFEVSEEARVKAGYKVPKMTISPEEFLRRNKIESLDVMGQNHHYVTDGIQLMMGPPKPMSAKTLAGDLTNQPVHLPINYFDRPSHSSKNVGVSLKPGSITKMNAGGDDVLVAKGPGGFSVGIFNAGKFGSFPSANQPIEYNPHNPMEEDPIKTARLNQIDPEEVKKNEAILNADYSSKTLPDITQTGQSLAEALIQVTEEAIKEPVKEANPEVAKPDPEVVVDINLSREIIEMKLKIEDQNRTIRDLVSSVESLSRSLTQVTQQVETLTKVIQEDTNQKDGILMTLYNKVAWWR